MGNTVITCLLIYTFILFTRWCSCNGNSPNNSTLMCKPSERAALLKFKHNLASFDKAVSSSWNGEECCSWSRVVCDNTTGHILQLDLSGDLIVNNLIPIESLVYLLELKQLESLDLCFNNFSYSSIPRFMGSMKQLKYLFLPSASLGGLIPYELGNLTNLQILDLSYNNLSGEIPASLGNLLNLNELDLSLNNLSSIASSLRFPSNLKLLDLSNNQLSGKIPTSIGQLSKLYRLHINSNPLDGTALSEPHFANLSSLAELYLEDTMLTLDLSSDWVPPFQLQALSADNCKINGQLPTWLQTQKYLTILGLSNVNISGLMPNWFHTMQQLKIVDLSNNHLSGSPIFPINFSRINLSNNSLSMQFLSNDSKTRVYCYADEILLGDNFIVGPLPEHLGLIMPNLTILSLSSNQIEGSIPNSLCQSTSLSLLDMQNNSLTGVLPSCWGLGQSNLRTLSLSNNQITGPIPDSLCQLTLLDTLDIKNNKLSGVIPNCLANLTSLTTVDLSNNKFKGHIPCFANLSRLTILDLSNNKLKGNIPCFNNSDSDTYFLLYLNDNMLSGEIPSCLKDLINLQVLDVGGNQLSGKMNKWFSAENFRELAILRLRGNKFSGTIPSHICSLPHLQLIDLGYNQFTGSIPRCLSNLTAMTSPNASSWDYIFSGVSEVMQGIERAYTSTLPYFVDIDLSCNNLVGSIPSDMTKISGLLNLNLSYNQLSGEIPENIGSLKKLISLDLSKNKLRGRIPNSISEIYTLSHLNLSYNNLSGQIPTGNQLQTLSDQASIYAGNPYLCGDFLPAKCKSRADELEKGTSNKGSGDKEKKLKKMGFDLVVMSGFATGFCGVVGCLVLSRRWRHAFFLPLEDGYNWLYVIVVLKMRALKAKIKRGE